jgi:hypothetical protein
MKSHGGTEYDIEEALCLLMQVKLSQQFAGTAADYRASARLAPSPRRTLLIELENDWPSYASSGSGDAADFVIAETIKTFRCGSRCVQRIGVKSSTDDEIAPVSYLLE